MSTGAQFGMDATSQRQKYFVRPEPRLFPLIKAMAPESESLSPGSTNRTNAKGKPGEEEG